MPKRIAGFVLWFDKRDGEGIISSLSGDDFYFNVWSFGQTHYRVTGKCKRTGRKKTISTRCFPGLFLKRREIRDPVCETLESGTPVVFEQAVGLREQWAVNAVIDKSKTARAAVWYCRLLGCWRSMKETEMDFKTNWHEYYDCRFTRLAMQAKEFI